MWRKSFRKIECIEREIQKHTEKERYRNIKRKREIQKIKEKDG